MSASAGTDLRVPLRGRPAVVLATCCLSLLVVALDATVVNIALPNIRRSLDASIPGLQWTVDAYTLVAACLLMFSGTLSDRFGRQHVFRVGLAIFGIGSLACGLAPSIGWLIAFRALQAVGGSMMNPSALALIVQAHPLPKDRARAIGIWGAVSGIAMAIGPPVGGTLTHLFGWRSVFWINIPIVALALTCATLFLPLRHEASRRPLDWAGQGLVALALGGLVFGLIDATRSGWGSPVVLGALGVAALAGLALLRVERRVRKPLVDLSLFRAPPFCAAMLVAIAVFAALAACMFLLPIELQVVRGQSAAIAGLEMLPLALCSIVAAPLSGRAVGAFGLRAPMALAGIMAGLGGLVLATAPAHAPLAVLMAGMALFGAGFGTVNAPISSAAIAGLPRERSSTAGAMASTARQVGVALGVALVGRLAGGGTDAMRPAWWGIVGVGVFVVGAALWATRGTAKGGPG